MADATKTDIVFLGLATLLDGKTGALWIARQTLDEVEADDLAVGVINRVASIFSKKTATGKTVGAIYATPAVMEEDRVTSITPSQLSFVGRSEHPAIMAFEAKDIAARDAERAKKAAAAVKASPLVMRELDATLRHLRTLPTRQALQAADAIRSLLTDAILKGR
jgi:hypothetical protein